VHLVISSRTDPPLPISRLRARGQMNELGAAELAFTESEAEPRRLELELIQTLQAPNV
jgi:ATP/maltotriose-dependent transcriptional regulator MalT